MSQINTNGVNVNYPVPGQNNSSQGFRDNFAQIKTNLDTASSEITDIQTKVIVKSALNNFPLDNDMGNTLISNCATRGFRSTTYNLGSALTGTIVVDVNRADLQYGTVTGNVTFQFGGWAPTNTESNVILRLNVSNTDAVISWPSQCISSNNNYGVTLLENFSNIANVATVTTPANTAVLEYQLSTINCGNTITINPTNRPYQTTQVITRDPPPTGLPGDVNGTVAVSDSLGQIEITDIANTPTVITANTFTGLTSNIAGTTMNIGSVSVGTITTGMVVTGAGITANTYIVSGSALTWVVSESSTTAASITITGTTGIITANSVPTLKVGVETSGTVQPGMILSGSGVTANTVIVKNLSGSGSGSTWQVSAAQFATPTTIDGNIDVVTTTDTTTGFYRDMPITFTGNTYGNITAGTTYYVKEVASNTAFTLSTTPGGAMLTLTDNTGNSMMGNPASYMYVSTNDFNSDVSVKEATNTYATDNVVKLNGTANLEVNAPIVFTGTTFGNIAANTVYYIKSIDGGNANITVSQARANGVAGTIKLLDTANGNCTATAYVNGNDIWKRLNLSAW